MRRRLALGRKPSFRDFKSFGKSHPSRFIEHRRNERFVRAIERGETEGAMIRRGLLNRLRP